MWNKYYDTAKRNGHRIAWRTSRVISSYHGAWIFSECFTHEEGKGWRRVNVGAELPTSSSGQLQSPSTEDSSIRLKSRNGKKSGSSTPEDEIGGGDANTDDASTPAQASHVELVKTTCGDNHNLGLDASGVPYRVVQLNFTHEIEGSWGLSSQSLP